MTTELLRPLTGPKTLDLRLYQTETIESLRVAARSGFQRIILCAPTGSGKTEMAIPPHPGGAAQGVQGDLCGGRHLAGRADQRSTVVLRYRARLRSGGKHLGPVTRRIQVAMAQTIAKREFWTDLDLLIIRRSATSSEKRFRTLLASGVAESSV